MRRPVGAAVAVLALLCGFSAAPYTHAHHGITSTGDEHHPPGAALVHTHASPHAHQDAGIPGHGPAGTDDEDRDDRIWSVDGFVFQPAAPDQAFAPVLLVAGQPHARLIGVSLDVHRPQPRAHGPPLGAPSGLRAPPAFLPAFA